MRIVKQLFVSSLGALVALCAVSCNKPQDGITLDADVPGAKVYLAEKELGTVPVTLSARKLAELGVPNPRNNPALTFNSDGFGETVFIAGAGDESFRFMFLVPATVRSDYVSAETPWGLRTRHAGGSFHPGESFRVNFATVIRRDGLTLRVEPLDPVSTNKVPWKLHLDLVNRGAQALHGFRPSIQICHSQ